MPSNGLQDFGHTHTHKKNKPPLPLQQQTADLRTGSECMDFRHGRQKNGFGDNVWSQPCVLGL